MRIWKKKGMDEGGRHHARVSRWRRTKQVGMGVKNPTHPKRFMYLVFIFVSWGKSMVWHRGKRMVTEATWTLSSFRGSEMRQDDTTAFSLAALADHSHA